MEPSISLNRSTQQKAREKCDQIVKYGKYNEQNDRLYHKNYKSGLSVSTLLYALKIFLDLENGVGKKLSIDGKTFYGTRKLSTIHLRIEPVGKGKFSKVYKTLQLTTGELVAFKVSRSGCNKPGRNTLYASTSRRLLWKERRIIRKIKSRQELPSLPKFYLTCIKYMSRKGGEEKVASSMELFHGNLRKNGIFSPEFQKMANQAKLLLCEPILKALKIIHENDIVHGDLKPDNIMYKKNPNSSNKRIRFVIADFGGANKLPDVPENYTNEYHPTDAPEDPKKADVFAMAKLLIELLSGVTYVWPNPAGPLKADNRSHFKLLGRIGKQLSKKKVPQPIVDNLLCALGPAKARPTSAEMYKKFKLCR